MKKAVGVLIPHMETERLAANKAAGVDPATTSDSDMYNGTVRIRSLHRITFIQSYMP
jgi:hypothetical protein